MAAVALSLDELQRWMAWAREMPTRDEILWLLRDGDAGFESAEAWQYFIFERESGELVGMAGLNNPRGVIGAIEISYWVRSD